MAINVSLAQRVEAPIDDVAAFMFDPVNDVRWVKDVTRSQVREGVPMAPGVWVDRTLNVSHHDVAIACLVKELDPPRRLVMDNQGEPGPIRFVYDLEPLDDGATLVRLELTGDAGGGLRGYAIRRALEKGVASSARRLAEVFASAEHGG